MLLDTCEARLTVHLSCSNLRNMDVLSLSDPFALLFLDPTGTVRQPTTDQASAPSSLQPSLRDAIPAPSTRSSRAGRYHGRDGRWERVGTTETIPDSLNPTFATSFEIPYFFERAQKLAVDVFDRDVASTSDRDIYRHDFLGSAEVGVPALVRARGQKLTLPLSIPDRSNRNCGYITIIVEYVSESKLRLNYEMSISQISKHSYIGKGRGPYLTVSRCSSESSQSDSWITVMRTAAPGVPNASGGFDLPRLTYNYEKFCRCDDNRQLRFDLSYEKGGKYRVVASALSSLRDCDRRDGFIELKPVERGCFPSTRRVPRLRLYNRRVTEDTTFLDYVIGGCEISLVIGIDFTASNGNPLQRGSLHFADSMGANEYEMAIRAVGDILAAYDSDQLFPTYGFGAKLPPDFDVPSHKFPLSGSEDANCHTIEDVLNMYRHTLYNVRLSGPTEFSQIIRAAAEHAAEEVAQNEQSYTILLIVTDGVINDLKCTLKEIERATSLPLSIVIIGVGGDADFTDMNLLDGDDLGHERDIVQFVNFRQYADTPEVLRAMVLEEIPQQLVQYMKQRGLEPYPPPVD